HLCWRGCTGRRRTGRHLPSRCARSPGGTVSGGCSRRLPPSACSRSRHPDTDAGRALRFRFRQLSRDRRSNRRRGAVNRRWKAAAWPESRADSHRQLATVCDAAGCPHFHQCLRGSGRRDGTRQLPGRGPAVYPIAGTSVRRRARRPLAARGARGPVPTLEESVKLDEPEPRVLRGNPVRSVVIAYAGSQLQNCTGVSSYTTLNRLWRFPTTPLSGSKGSYVTLRLLPAAMAQSASSSPAAAVTPLTGPHSFSTLATSPSHTTEPVRTPPKTPKSLRLRKDESSSLAARPRRHLDLT